MIQIIIRPIAEADIREAVDWYDGRQLGLGTRFLDEVRDTFIRISLCLISFPASERVSDAHFCIGFHTPSISFYRMRARRP